MVFSSLEFIFWFLPVFLVIYYLVPVNGKNLWLFVGSLGFYFYGVRDTPFYFILLVLSILVNYKIGTLIGRRRFDRFRKRWLVYGVIYNLFWLVLYKYTGFLMQNLNQLLNMAKIPVELPVIAPVLPVGISFYTFQAISYLVDVYRKTVPYERSLIGFGMYISMFPQLIAGPIVTYSSVRRQIYFDFCGYSLMAKGLGSMMGFQLPDNFHHPYMSLSMTEFWRRWRVVGHLYMAFMIPLTWLVFAIPDMGKIALYFQRLFPFFAKTEQFFYFSGDYIKYGKLYAVSLAAGLLFMTDIPMRIYERFKYSMIMATVLVGIFWLCIYCMRMGFDDPFLYFRF